MWWATRWIVPEAFDPLWPRLGLWLGCWGLALASLLSEAVERRLYRLMWVLAALGTWWIAWLVDQNAFAAEHMLVAMMVCASNLALMSTLRQIVAYGAFVVLAIALNASTGGNGPPMLGACAGMMGVLMGLSVRHREELLEQLTQSRDLLEQRVQERTAELVHETRDRRAAEQAALSALRAKSRFLEGMSHEIRTPLNAIVGYASLVLDDCEDGDLEQIPEDVGQIEDAAARLLGMVDQILELARLEHHGSGSPFRPVSLRALLGVLAEQLQPLLERHDNQMRVEVEAGAGSMVTDPELLRQILSNLLSNAAQFTEQGSIQVRCWSNSGCIYVAVEDTGCGIPPDRIATLFDRFERTASTSEGGHAGLGLAICQRAAALMGGIISVRSEVGQGSTFTLRLPDHRAPQRPPPHSPRPPAPGRIC